MIKRFQFHLNEMESIVSQLDAKYDAARNTPSDIWEHISNLYDLAKDCESIIELGVRTCVSSWPFIKGLRDNGKPVKKYIGCDVIMTQEVLVLEKEAKNCKIDFEFKTGNDLGISFPEADLVFIDTWHVYGQLKRELEHMHGRAKKFIVMHDTESDAINGEGVRTKANIEEQSKMTGIPVEEIAKGLRPAIEEFLVAHPEWEKWKHFINNNGLTILRRRPPPEKSLLNDFYFFAANLPGDIDEHMGTIADYASKVSSVAELGCRGTNSCWALLKGLTQSKATHKVFFGCDLARTEWIPLLEKECQLNKVTFTFVQAPDLSITLPNAELYFIDTWHCYPQLIRELATVASKTKWIILHTTETDKLISESVRCKLDIEAQAKATGYSVTDIAKGMQYAIDEFVAKFQEWEIFKTYTNNNGLVILKKTPKIEEIL